MSSQELANQASGFSNFAQQYQERGQNAINDFNMEEQEYNGAEVAHRNGINAIKTGAELPRLAESFMLKPLAKKLITMGAKKLGFGDKLEGLTKTATALKEGRYGDAASAAAETAGVTIPKDVDTLITKCGKNVRQLGSDTFKKLSENARGKLTKGTVDENGIPYNSKDFSANDVRRGIQQGRLKVNEDDSITDTTTGETHTIPSTDRLPGGAKATFENGQVRLESEDGEAWNADKAFGGDSGEAAPSTAYENIQRNVGGFEGSPQTQANLNRMTAETDQLRGSVDFRGSGRIVEDAGKVSAREQRIQQLTGRQARPPAAEPAPIGAREPSLAGARLQEQPTAAPAVAQEESAAAAARTTTTQGGYADQLAPMRELANRSKGVAEGAEGRLASEANIAKPTLPGEAATTKLNLPQSLIQKSKGRQAPVEEAKPAELPTSSSTFATKGETIGKDVEEGIGTIGKSVGEAEVKTAGADEVPGLGEVVMGLSAAWGLIKGGIKEGKEIKADKADAPAPPPSAAAQTASQPQSGVSFNVAPVIDSDSYHHL
jgi:hypothetical protein